MRAWSENRPSASYSHARRHAACAPTQHMGKQTTDQHGAGRVALVSALALVCAVLVSSGSAAAQAAPGAAPVDVGNPCASPPPVAGTGGGGANNIVIVHNPTRGDLQVRGSVQLNHVLRPTVGNVNCAAAPGGA